MPFGFKGKKLQQKCHLQFEHFLSSAAGNDDFFANLRTLKKIFRIKRCEFESRYHCNLNID